MKNLPKIIIGIAIVVLIILGATGVFEKTSELDGEIQIGSILIQTGDGASWGEAARNGIDLAVKEINADGGVLGKQLSVIHEDDQGDPAKTIGAFRKLTEINDVKFIIGPSWTKNGLAVMDLVSDEVVISPTLGNADFNESSPFIFNTWPHDYILSAQLADYVYDKGYVNVAILGANDVWVKEQTIAFKERFEELGASASFVFEPTVDQRDLRTDLTKIKNDVDIDAVIVTSDGYGITSIYGRQMQELGIELPVYAITLDQTVIGNCEGSCDGWEYLTFLTPTKSFEKKYIAEYDRNVEVGADSAYDAVMLIAKAMEVTESTDTNLIQEYLNGVTSYRGASGNLVSDGKGDFVKDYVKMLIKDGESTPIR